jgi:hypothetical protein
MKMNDVWGVMWAGCDAMAGCMQREAQQFHCEVDFTSHSQRFTSAQLFTSFYLTLTEIYLRAAFYLREVNPSFNGNSL